MEIAFRYLYILVDKDGNSCKVGISICPMKRANILSESFDYEQSVMISMPFGSARAVEKFLHKVMRDLSISKMKGDGYTEWFKIEARAKVIGIIDSFGEELMVNGWVRFCDFILPEKKTSLITKMEAMPNENADIVSTVNLIYPSQEVKDEIDRYFKVTRLTRGREFVKAMLKEIAREKKAGRYQ